VVQKIEGSPTNEQDRPRQPVQMVKVVVNDA
jgi:hypothetical protein